MNSSRLILASVAGIAAVSIFNAVQKKQGITRIVAGAYILLLLLSLLDLFGGAWAQIAGGIAMLALVTVVLTQIPWASLTLFTKGSTATTATAPVGEPPATTRGPQQ